MISLYNFNNASNCKEFSWRYIHSKKLFIETNKQNLGILQ
jgi:hypothetical protein